MTPLTAAVLAATSLAGCAGEDSTGAGDEATSHDSASQTLTYEAVSNDLASRAGEEISVRATVGQIITQGVFALTGSEGPEPESIVVVDAAPSKDIEAGTDVVVTGTVHEELDDLEVEDILEVQLEDELLLDWEDEAYIEAQQVETEPEGA